MFFVVFVVFVVVVIPVYQMSVRSEVRLELELVAIVIEWKASCCRFEADQLFVVYLASEVPFYSRVDSRL